MLDIMLNLSKPVSGVVCLSGLNLSIDDKIKIDEKFPELIFSVSVEYRSDFIY